MQGDDEAVYAALKPLLEGSAIYHCGPVVAGLQTKEYRFVAAGPTTSTREELKTVVVEADVSAAGGVTGTRVVRNDTGDPALAELAVHEVRQMRFAPPVRRCVTLPFVYVFQRTF